MWLHGNVLKKEAIKILRTNDEITKKCIRMEVTLRYFQSFIIERCNRQKIKHGPKRWNHFECISKLSRENTFLMFISLKLNHKFNQKNDCLNFKC